MSRKGPYWDAQITCRDIYIQKDNWIDKDFLRGFLFGSLLVKDLFFGNRQVDVSKASSILDELLEVLKAIPT